MVVYALEHETERGTYLQGVFVGPFSAMRWADVGHYRTMVWHRCPIFGEWEGHLETTDWQHAKETWVIKRKDVWEY